MQTIHLTSQIKNTLSGKRLDQALALLFPEFSRSRLQAWILAGQVTVDGKLLRPKDHVFTGQQIEINATVEDQEKWLPQEISLAIVHEDEALLIVDKPAGLVVHPGAGNPDQTLVNALLHHDKRLSYLPRAGIIHRLDKDTSGLLIVAKTLESYHFLTQELKARKITREYRAIVQGTITKSGSINEPIGRHPKLRTKMSVIPKGKPSVTHYEVLENFPGFTYLAIKLETGRTHQIRVHLAFIHHPIVGDSVYGSKLKIPPEYTEKLAETLNQFPRQALHAYQITLTHPTHHCDVSWTSPLPEDMQALIKALKNSITSNKDRKK